MAWNVFKFCTSLRALGSIMIVLVLAISGVTYYALVIGNYGPALFHGGANTLISLAVLLLFHFLLVMLFWCYTCVVVTDPGGVPTNWRPLRDEETSDTDPLMDPRKKIVQLASLQSSMMGKPAAHQEIRFCQKCKHLKPPRAHHCSTCKRCILKMDHHCVWVVNCVGALNYKHFLLFLFYTFLETSLVSVSLFPIFLSFFGDGETSQTPGFLAATFITFVLNVAFALSVLGFLIMHISLVAANTTTIEAFEKKTIPNWHFDLGWKRNFEQVFGTQKKLWLIPAYSEDDLKRMPALKGLDFPTRNNDFEPLQQQF